MPVKIPDGHWLPEDPEDGTVNILILENTEEARCNVALQGYGHSEVILAAEHLYALVTERKMLAWTDGEYTTTLVWDGVS